MVRKPPPSLALAFEELSSQFALLCLSTLLSQWLPRALVQWQALLFKQTHRLLLLAPDVVGRDRTLSLVSMADHCTRAVLPKVPVAGKAMLSSYSEWVEEKIEVAEQDQQQLIDAVIQLSKSPLSLAIHQGNAPLTTGSPRSLQAVCEYYLHKNDGLQRMNKSLVAHIGSLESELQHAQASIFDAQRIVSCIKEVEEVRAKRLHVTPAVFRAFGHEDPRFSPTKPQKDSRVQPEDNSVDHDDQRFSELRTVTVPGQPEGNSVEAQAQEKDSHLMNDPVTRVKAEDTAEDELYDDLKEIGTVWIGDSAKDVAPPIGSLGETRGVEHTDVDDSVHHESTRERPPTAEVDALRTAMGFTTKPNTFEKLTTADPPSAGQEEPRAVERTDVDASVHPESTGGRSQGASVFQELTGGHSPNSHVDALRTAMGPTTTPNTFEKLKSSDSPGADKEEARGVERTGADASVLHDSTAGRPRTYEVDNQDPTVDIQDPTPYDPEKPAIDSGGETSFSQLLELDGPKPKEETATDSGGSEDSWHRRALRRLAKEREQRRRRSRSQSLTSSTSPGHSGSSFVSSVDTDVSLPRNSLTSSNGDQDDANADEEDEPEAPLDFQSLVALRASNDVRSTAEWQHRALRVLTKERERLPQCHRPRSASASPTHKSSTSPLNFLYE
ncbi:hypothetical protein Gpo141_00012672 [Globisporangium polare]